MLYERDSNRKRDKLGVLREREREREREMDWETTSV